MGKSAVQDIITHTNLTQRSPRGDDMAKYLFHTDTCTLGPGVSCNCGLMPAAGHASTGGLVADTRKWAQHLGTCKAGGEKKVPCTCGHVSIWGRA